MRLAAQIEMLSHADVLVTDTWISMGQADASQKRAAMEHMNGQVHLWDYYTRVAQQRANHFKYQVERDQRPVIERRKRQLFGKTTGTFDFNAVVNNQAEHAQRHTQRGVRVRGRYNFHVLNA